MLNNVKAEAAAAVIPRLSKINKPKKVIKIKTHSHTMRERENESEREIQYNEFTISFYYINTDPFVKMQYQ